MPALAPLLSVSLSHEYFGGAFAEFSLGALPQTAATCARLGLYLLRDAATLTLFARLDPRRPAAMTALQAALAASTLCWELAPIPPAFGAFTAIDFVGSRQRIVLTSADDAAAGGELTIGSLVSSSDVWSGQPLNFDFRPAKPLRVGSTLRLETAARTRLGQYTVADPNLVAVDVSAFGSGLYRLKQGSVLLAEWFADERGPIGTQPTPNSMLVLPGALLAAAFGAAASGGSAAPPAYTASYPARTVTWRYHVFNTQPGESLQIGPADDLGATDAPPAPAKSGRRGRRQPAPVGGAGATDTFVPLDPSPFPPAVSFAAVDPLQLAQRPPQRFALRNGSTVRYSPLPVAGPSLATNPAGTGFCSDIFVYL